MATFSISPPALAVVYLNVLRVVRDIPDQSVDRHHLILDLLENRGGLELGNWARSALRVLLTRATSSRLEREGAGQPACRCSWSPEPVPPAASCSPPFSASPPCLGPGTLVGPLQVLDQSSRRERGHVGYSLPPRDQCFLSRGFLSWFRAAKFSRARSCSVGSLAGGGGGPVRSVSTRRLREGRPERSPSRPYRQGSGC